MKGVDPTSLMNIIDIRSVTDKTTEETRKNCIDLMVIHVLVDLATLIRGKEIAELNPGKNYDTVLGMVNDLKSSLQNSFSGVDKKGEIVKFIKDTFLGNSYYAPVQDAIIKNLGLLELSYFLKSFKS